MSYQSKYVKNLSFLQKLKEKKDILFGKFSDSLNREIKQNEWEDLRKFCFSIGLITNDKDYVFVRNNTWGNLRKKTMKKIDASKKTGTEGCPDQKLDDLDLLVLDVIGKDSPAVEGLGVPDSFAAGPSTVQLDNEDLVANDGGCSVEVCNVMEPLQKRMFDIQKKTALEKLSRKRPVSAEHFQEYEELKKKKLKLEIENLAMDLFIKEVANNMPPSEYTEHLHKKRPVEVLNIDDFQN